MNFCQRVSSLAIKSMLYEVSASPKPGLVDRINQGAHNDMDFFTFMDSISVLFPYYEKCTQVGLSFNENDYTVLMDSLRDVGIEAENNMFNATRNVNTHKGMIFSLGILSAALGSLKKDYNRNSFTRYEIQDRVKKMTKGITKELLHSKNKDYKDLTYGERLYRDYNISGIRGEAESGYETVISISLPEFERLYNEHGKKDINNILIQTLIFLMSETEDSNILGRHDVDVLKYVKDKSKIAINLGGIYTKEGQDYIDRLDKEFIKLNISSGGAADLLAVTLFIFLVEKGELDE